MAYLSEQAAYLRGLAEGMEIDGTKNEGKLLLKIIDVLEELAATVEDIDAESADNAERLDDVEDCLDDICEDLYDDCDCDCDCDCDDLEDYDDEDLDFYEVECPSCNEKVYFDEDMIDDEILVCPNCNEKIEIEFEEDDE